MRGGRVGRFSGFANNENLYTAFLFLAGTLCAAAAVAFSENALYREYGLLHGKECRISAVSLLVSLFRGTQPVISTVSKETTEPFRIPALWALCMICFFLMIGLTVEEMRGAAYQRILREGSRAKWAGRICCKISARVLLWYACLLGSAVVLAFCLGGTWVPGDRGAFLLMSGVPEELLSPVYLCAALGLSVLAMLAMAFFQAVICLLVSSMMGIVTDEIHCRLVNISLHVKNTGTTPQSSEALLGYLVTGAYHNGFILSQEEFQKFPLGPGKEVTVTGNCLLSSTGFSKSQWKHLEKRGYALSLSVYPKSVKMKIAI